MAHEDLLGWSLRELGLRLSLLTFASTLRQLWYKLSNVVTSGVSLREND